MPARHFEEKVVLCITPSSAPTNHAGRRPRQPSSHSRSVTQEKETLSMKKTLSGEDPFGWVSSLVGQAESRDDPKGPHVLTKDR